MRVEKVGVDRSTGMISLMTLVMLGSLLGGCGAPPQTEHPAESEQPESTLLLPEEVHLRNLRQLTFG